MSQTIDTERAAEFFRENDRFAIIPHASADGDTLGSAYALCRALLKLGKNVKVTTPEPPSVRFDYLKAGMPCPEFSEEFYISVDVADSALLGDLEKPLDGRIDLCIDHHISNTGYAKSLLLDGAAAATCEIIFGLIKRLEEISGIDIMDADIAACVYTGVSTDTGCFRFSNTTSRTHIIAAKLIDYGFDCAGLNYLLFEMRTKERIKLEKQALDSIEFRLDGKCAMIALTKAMLAEADDEDVNAISSLSRQVGGVELGVTLKERETDVWKISLRSNNYIDSSLICRKFGGGGHKRAAGCRITGALEDVKAKLLKEIELYI